MKKLSILSLVVVSNFAVHIQAMEREVKENRQKIEELYDKFDVALKTDNPVKKGAQFLDIRREAAEKELFFRGQKECGRDCSSTRWLISEVEKELFFMSSGVSNVTPRTFSFPSDSDSSDSDNEYDLEEILMKKSD